MKSTELMPLRLERSRITEYESTTDEGLYVSTIRHHFAVRSHTATTKRDRRFYEMRLDLRTQPLYIVRSNLS